MTSVSAQPRLDNNNAPTTSTTNTLHAPYAQDKVGSQPIYQPINMSESNSPQPSSPYSYQHAMNNDDVPPCSAQGKDEDPENKPKPNNSDQSPGEDNLNKPSLHNNVKVKASSFRFCKITEENFQQFLNYLLRSFPLLNLCVLIPLAVYFYGHEDVGLVEVGSSFSYISFSLTQHPILDVRVQDDGTECPADYYSILLGTWPGTKMGCQCPGYSLRSGYCDKDENSDDPTDTAADWDCDDIYPRLPIKMYNWGGSKWCVLRAQLGTQYTKSASCAVGFRKCSSGICVLDTIDCPVTKVRVDTTGTYKLKLGTNRYIVTEKVQGESPVIDLAVTPNDIPCFSEDYFAAGPVGKYVLLNGNEDGCTKYGLDDKYSFKFDTQKQGGLFSMNSFPADVMNLPEYPSFYSVSDSILSYRVRMDVIESDFCLNFDTELLEKSTEFAEGLDKFMKKTLLAALIIHGILLVFTFGSFVSNWQETSSFITAINAEALAIFSAFFGFLEFITSVVMFAATSHFRKQMISNYDDILKVNCFIDDQPRDIMAEYSSFINVIVNPLFGYSIGLFLVTLICVALPVSYACIYLCINSKRK